MNNQHSPESSEPLPSQPQIVRGYLIAYLTKEGEKRFSPLVSWEIAAELLAVCRESGMDAWIVNGANLP